MMHGTHIYTVLNFKLFFLEQLQFGEEFNKETHTCLLSINTGIIEYN